MFPTRDLGFDVNVRTVSEPTDVEWMVRFVVSRIIDDPALVRTVLGEGPQRCGR